VRIIVHFKLLKKQVSAKHATLILVCTCLYTIADSCNVKQTSWVRLLMDLDLFLAGGANR